MNVYIDESGSFVNAPTANKWNAVAALTVPEAARKKLDELVYRLRIDSGVQGTKEIKLHQIPENRYFRFLSQLEEINALVFCTATDAGHNTNERVAEHQSFQVDGVLKHIDKMKYEGGRRGVELMASQLR